MAAHLSRISLVVEGEGGSESQGNLTSAAAGFGLFQTWLYAMAFGTMGVPYDVSLFNLQAVSWFPMPPVFFVAAASIGLVLMVLGVAAQRKLRWFVGRRVVVASSLMLVVGVLAVLQVPSIGRMETPLFVVVGLVLGVGSALLTLFWGAAFSRLSMVSIAINAALATVGSIVLYVCMVRLIPFGLNKWIVIFLLPLVQVPFALRAAPRTLAEAHSVPMFDVLPVKRGPFAARFVFSMLLFGVALGMLRSVTTVMIRGDVDISLQLVALVLAVVPAVMVLMNMLRHDEADRWEALFKPLMLVVGVTACVAPVLAGDASGLSLFLSFAGYLSFEASMWVFFTGLAQDFRLSPVFLVGVGRGVLSLGSLMGMCLATNPPSALDALPYGQAGMVVLVMLGIMVGYVLVPRFEAARDVARQGGGARVDAEAAACAAERSERAALAAEMDEPSVSGGSAGAAGFEVLSDAALGAGAAGGLEAEAAADAPGRGVGTGAAAGAAAGADAGMDTPTPGAAPTPALADMRATTRQREPRYDEALKVACERIAGRYLLSQRQTEVLYLLARGHTAPYIQDKLCVTLSTAKSHIYNIYRKLDIHKQHELLSMVEEELESLRQ